MSPLDLYRSEGLQVQREDQRLGPGNYTGMDEAIDSLRRGDKMPSGHASCSGLSLLEYLTNPDVASGNKLGPMGNASEARGCRWLA